MGAGELTCQGLLNLLEDNDPDLDPPLSSGLEHVVQAVLVVLRRGPAQV